ncbi:hypothetical protein E2562_039358 [Oryza meyeriana var. granulata]|uniref:Uncharacterized protein n=1 Tax=Oryza meyeriana var. granulata TaxID=110450 RepID=A0A6G1E9W7_9ORYZ|nr:hypothetical protein E2562_039358 [Oryza meyeriana var. granulata]
MDGSDSLDREHVTTTEPVGADRDGDGHLPFPARLLLLLFYPLVYSPAFVLACRRLASRPRYCLSAAAITITREKGAEGEGVREGGGGVCFA